MPSQAFFPVVYPHLYEKIVDLVGDSAAADQVHVIYSKELIEKDNVMDGMEQQLGRAGREIATLMIKVSDLEDRVWQLEK